MKRLKGNLCIVEEDTLLKLLKNFEQLRDEFLELQNVIMRTKYKFEANLEFLECMLKAVRSSQDSYFKLTMKTLNEREKLESEIKKHKKLIKKAENKVKKNIEYIR